MLTSSGPLCDICNNYILLDKNRVWFKITGIFNKLCCHEKCKPILQEAIEKDDWKLLPEGPLRKVFETQQKLAN